MLSAVIKEMLEKRVGYEIRYPSDCERLMYEIADTTHQHIGVTTLKRLFGFVNGTSAPRMSTLDILAHFLGYRNYDQLLLSLDPDKETSTPPIRQIQSADIKPGSRLKIGYQQGQICLDCCENGRFRIVQSTDSSLQAGDIVSIRSFRVNYPLFIHQILRNDSKLKEYIAAKVSGIESIEMNCPQ